MHFFSISKFKSYSFQNFLSGLIQQFIAGASGFILPRLIILHYGSVLNGLLSTVTQMMAYLAIVEVGLSSAALVALYKPMAEHDYLDASATLAAIDKFYKHVAFYFSAGTVIGGVILQFIIEDDISLLTIWLVIAAMAANNLVTYLFLGKYKVLLQSDNRMFVSNYVRCISVILQFLASLIIIYADWNIAILRVVAVAISMIEFILLWSYTRHSYPEIQVKVEPKKGAIKQRRDILVHQISALILNNTDVLLLTVFGSTLALVSVYSVYNMIMITIYHIVTSFMSMRSTIFAKLYVLNRMDDLKREVSKFEVYFLVVVFGLNLCMAVLIMPFIRLYTRGFNDAIYDVPIYGLLFSVLGICRVQRGCYSEIINSAGKFKETKIQSINSTWINIAVSMALIWKFQIAGILVGSIVAELYRTIHCMCFFNKNIFPFEWKVTVSRFALNTIVATLIYIFTGVFRRSSYNNYMEALCSMGIISVVIMGIVFLSNIFLEKISKRNIWI